MPLKSRHKVITPHQDLREGKPLDAAEFAVHLDDVRTNAATPLVGGNHALCGVCRASFAGGKR
jgi:hypothetical protein